MFQNWYVVTQQALQSLWQGAILDFLPRLIGALIVFVIGLLIAAGLGRLIADVLRRIKFNQIFERGTWKGVLEKAEVKMDPSGFLGGVVKWVLVIVFISISLEILGFSEFTALLNGRVLPYLPNVVVAAFFFVVAAIVADLVEKVVRVTLEGAQAGYARTAGSIVKWAIWIFAVVLILDQLQVAETLTDALIYGIVAFFAIAGGLAFGLGGKEVAGDILQDLKNRLRD